MKFDGIYRGIIIQNNDPDNMGRVKVFVPHISMTLYKDWNEDYNNNEDIFFKSAGENLDSKLTPEILKRLKESLPWGEVLQPILGPSGSGYYQAELDHATVEGGAIITKDKERLETFVGNAHKILKTLVNNVMDPLRIGYNSTGEKSYNKSVGENTSIVNTLPALTSNQGNLPNGFISIPDVMNTVWVIFEDGNPLKPLVVGAIHSREDHLANSGITEDLQ